MTRRAVGKLGGGERAVLLALIAAHPAASCGQLALMFRARAGREVSRGAVWRARTAGYRPPGRGPGRNLGPAEREVLTHLCLEAAPGYCRSEVRRQFAAATGRPISSAAVSR